MGIVTIILAGIGFSYFMKKRIYLDWFPWKLRNQDLAQANAWLSNITDYKKQLHRSQFGYYHYMVGLSYGETPAKSGFYMKTALKIYK